MMTLDENGYATAPGEVRVYNADPVTGEFIGQSVEYLAEGVGLPGAAFLDAPPQAVPGFALCREAAGKAWALVPDYRGRVAYEVSSGRQVTLNELGALPADLTLIAPQSDFDAWNGDAWVTDDAAVRQAAIAQGEAEKETRISQANQQMQFLQTQLSLGMISDDDKQILIAWVKYVQGVKAIDATRAPDITWPDIPL